MKAAAFNREKLVIAIEESVQKLRIVLDLNGHEGVKEVEQLFGQFVAVKALAKLLEPAWNGAGGATEMADQLATLIAADFEAFKRETGGPS